jgi:hypothetical protein
MAEAGSGSGSELHEYRAEENDFDSDPANKKPNGESEVNRRFALAFFYAIINKGNNFIRLNKRSNR